MSQNYTPELPEIFPQDDITVEEEQHQYQTYEGKSGSVLEKTDYVLDKAPIGEIIKVTGVIDGETDTFDESSYTLADDVRNKKDSFVFSDEVEEYILDYDIDDGSTEVVDEFGNSYIYDVDYTVVETNSFKRGTLLWLDDGNSPNPDESFTVSYENTFEDSVIRWDPSETTPAAGSYFYVTYRADKSLINRYTESGTEQFARIEDKLDDIVQAKFIDQAEGDELNKLGDIFGVLGKRRGRNDTQYRIYLKSIVQSFISRGTVNGIKLAISAATDVPLEDITVNEDFEENEYEVQIIAATPITGSLLESVAQIADPSGVALNLTRFKLPADETVINDFVSFTEGQQISEDFFVDDSSSFTRRGNFDEIVSDDELQINPNKFTTLDELFGNDFVTIDPNKSITSDTTFVDDTGVANRAEANEILETDDVFAINGNLTEITDETIDVSEILDVQPSNKNAHRWEDDSSSDRTAWNFFEWTEIVELARTLSDSAFVDDEATVATKDAIVSEAFFSGDAVDIRFNVNRTTDTAFLDDAVTIPPTDATTVDIGGSSDSVTNISSTLVTWDSQDWGTLEWVQEHN